MATTDVIFRIGTLGISKTQAELGMAAVALVAIGKAVAGVVEEADKFSDQWTKLTADQKKSVMEMDKATKGFVSTTQSMTTVAKLAAAGMKPTSDQLKSMALLAASTAKNLGEGPEGATTRLNKLTEALVRGRTLGLKEYGIELKKTGDISRDQAAALSEIEKRANGLEIEIDGLDDKWAAMNNTLDKSTGLLFTLSSQNIPYVGDAIDWVTGTFSNFNEIMVRTNGSYLNMMFDIEMSSLGWQGLVNDLASATAGFLGLDNAAYLFSLREKDLKNKATSRAKEIIGKDKANVVAQEALAKAQQESAVRPARSGGGGRAKPPDEMVFTEEQAFGTSDVVGDVQRDRLAYEESMLRNQIEMEEELAQQQEKSIEREGDYLANLREEYVQWGLTADRKAELWTLEEMNAESQYERTVRQMELEDQQLFQMERQVTMQDALKNAVRSSAVHMSASTAMVESGWKMTTNALQMGVRAAIQGRKDFAKAMRDMVVDVLTSLAEMAAVQALVQFAEAIADAASYNYGAAAQHAASGALWIAVAAAAGAGAAALGRAGGSGGGRGGRDSMAGATAGAGGGSSPMDYGGGGGNQETPVIIINVEGSMSSLFNNLRIESRRQLKSGEDDGGWAI